MYTALRDAVAAALRAALEAEGYPTDDLGLEDPPADVDAVLASSVAFRLASEAGAPPPQVAAELAEKLRDVRDPDGNRVFSDVYRGEEVYHSSETHLAPALVVDMNHGYHVPGSLGGDEAFRRPNKWRGENKDTGLFAAWGEGVATGGPLRRTDGDYLTITDLAPTILHWLDCPVPEDVDGSVRTELFADGTLPATSDVATRSPINHASTTDGDAKEIEDRLEDLGYM